MSEDSKRNDLREESRMRRALYRLWPRQTDGVEKWARAREGRRKAAEERRKRYLEGME